MSYDNSVLRDAASQLEAAARRLRKAILIKEEHLEAKRNMLVGEARALLHAAEARIQ